MSDEGVTFTRLNIKSADLAGRFPFLDEAFKLYDAMDKESDRGQVLISCSLLDEILKRIVLSFLVDCKQSNDLVDGFNAPLGTFSSRIKVTYALGLMSDAMFREIEIIRKIRNAFAHEIHVSFDDPRLRDMAGNLAFVGYRTDGKEMTAVEKFTSSAKTLVLSLGHRPTTMVDHQRKKLPNSFDDFEE